MMETWGGCDMPKLIAAAARVKAGVVSRDQFEKGERRKLNLGHTFAHAIETLAQQRGMDITHGEAVAMGMVLAARLSERLSEHLSERLSGSLSECVSEGLTGISGKDCSPFKTEEGLASRIENAIRHCGMKADCPFELHEMAEAMRKDKKAEGGKVHFVLPRAIGDVVICDLTVDEVIGLLA